MIGSLRARANASMYPGGPSVRITLPIDMKNLREDRSNQYTDNLEKTRQAYPKVAPDPSMYFPNVRMIPFCPAPY